MNNLELTQELAFERNRDNFTSKKNLKGQNGVQKPGQNSTAKRLLLLSYDLLRTMTKRLPMKS